MPAQKSIQKPIQNQIRLTKNAEIEKVLEYLKTVYPLLSETEILKLSLSQTYTFLTQTNNQANLSKIPFSNQPFLSQEIQQNIAKSKQDIAQNNSFTGSAEQVFNWLEN